MKNATIEFDPSLIQRYDKAGPRYTSYPTAVQFHENFGEQDYQRAAEASNLLHRQGEPRPLSLYFHIPFCSKVCFFCGCSKVVTKFRDRAAPYLDRLHQEIALHAKLFDDDRTVDQLHWGGGTPTFISHEEMRALMEATQRHFKLRGDDTGEYSIEIDPREIDGETLSVLRGLGFNRISLGVQDFDPKVQQAVNRIQPEAQTRGAITGARELGYKSISVDLIYGLPFQTASSFNTTLDKIIDLSPDRLSVFNYAHLPGMFKPQRRINAQDLPSPQEKLAILQQAIEKLTTAGYVYIGMDHFAKPDDELAIAQREGKLYRNFQGYSTHADCDLIAMGITAIGKVGNAFSQNVKTLEQYYAVIDSGHLPVYRGLALSGDDLLRQKVISELICHFDLHIPAIEQAHGIVFADYFATELQELTAMQDDALLEIRPDRITVRPIGRLLIRNICMVFDKYLRQQTRQAYSKVI
ncbi:MAG: oxygen-independent coproporphyrinogen III oxidase [Gammaproteobacteria bacterium]|nr:oxygen-independent coproporphyrinogen III oxidase [Gammaproteobacteria bacterium]